MSNISSLTTIRITVPAAPTWASSMSLNTWTQLSNTNIFTDVQAADVGQVNNSGPIGVFRDWGSAALATGFGSHGSMIHWNGGHNGYWGNEVYRFDLSTLTWTRLNEPSVGPYPPNNSNGLYSDDTPIVPHTYNYVGYRPTGNQYWTVSREINNLGDYTTLKPSRFNLSSLTWTNSTQVCPISAGASYGTACFDSTRDCVWVAGAVGRNFAKYDFATDTWTSYNPNWGGWGQSIIAHCPTKDILLLFSNNAAPIYGYNCNAMTTPPTALTVTGTAPTTSWSNTFSIKWSSQLGKFIYYTTIGGAAIYTLTPPAGSWSSGTWTWAQLSVTSAPIAPTAESGGVYGKFQVAEWGSTVVGILNNRYNGNCQAIRFQ